MSTPVHLDPRPISLFDIYVYSSVCVAAARFHAAGINKEPRVVFKSLCCQQVISLRLAVVRGLRIQVFQSANSLLEVRRVSQLNLVAEAFEACC